MTTATRPSATTAAELLEIAHGLAEHSRTAMSDDEPPSTNRSAETYAHLAGVYVDLYRIRLAAECGMCAGTGAHSVKCTDKQCSEDNKPQIGGYGHFHTKPCPNRIAHP